MALDFPANPTNGQVYDAYVYNSTVGAWQAREDSKTVAVLSATVPASANPGDIWINTNDGIAFVYYDDGTSAQWIELLPSGVPLLDLKANLAGDNSFSSGVNYFGSGGLGGTFISSTTGRAQFTVNSTSGTPLMVRGPASHTADLQQWQNSAGVVLADVGPTGIIEAPSFVSTQATGTAPLTVSSTTAVTNLNADLLDGQHGSVYSPAGMVSQFAGATAPTGWLLCDGAAVSRTTFANLFTAIGTSYGAGNGSTTFNLPNLKGRVPVGRDAADTSFDALGETGGAKTHTLTESEMPSHTHLQNSHNHTQNPHNHNFSYQGTEYASWTAATGFGSNINFIVGNGTVAATSIANRTATNQETTATNQNTGGGAAHNNLQPYIVMNYIIKV